MKRSPQTAQEAFDDLHRAMRDFGLAFVESLRIPQLVDWLTRVLNRMQR